MSTLRQCWEQTCAQATDAASQRLPAGCPSPRREFLQLNVLVCRGVPVPLMSQQGRGAAGLLRALLSPRGGPFAAWSMGSAQPALLYTQQPGCKSL